MKKAAIVVGHTEDNQGACSPHNISCEWEFNYAVATELMMRDVADIYLYDTYKGGYSDMVKRNVSQVNAGNHNLILELHYNAASPTAHGCEALYNHKATEDWNEVRLGKMFCDLMEERLGLRNRGVKHVATAKERGYCALYYPKVDTLILEPFFGTNENDCEIMRDGFMDYVDIIEEIILA